MPIISYEQFQQQRSYFFLDKFLEQKEAVSRIIKRVRQEGDSALRELTRFFDGGELDDLKVTSEEMARACVEVEPDLKQAIRKARDNIEQFHRQQLPASWWKPGEGWLMGQRFTPLSSVGIYAPGGTACYPSSVLMAAVPASLAGVKQIFLCTPADNRGQVNPVTLVAAQESGVHGVFKVGGAQAIAAMAYGTETVPRVDKIVGPGNIYVTLAKKEVFGQVGIDLLAGPSELLIVADEQANPAFIAADLLSQAEHDILSRVFLATTSRQMVERVLAQLEEQLVLLPRRETVERCLRDNGAVILLSSREQSWEVANQLAPEHLELHLAEPWSYLDRFKNAGAIFIGPYSPSPLGDYWAGSNHVLPTGGTARYASPLGVMDFLKYSQVIYYSPEPLRQAGPSIEAIARREGLEAHARAVSIRGRDDEPDSKD
ncbi:MAG TPA: histidinol dehydrogenase [Firmicutes bacterium]|nr:histidinol dehydrogenase [Bacillota bacterium]